MPRTVVGYVTGLYPRFSHLFIEREINDLRAGGLSIVPFSIRRAPDGELAGPHQRAVRAETLALLPTRPDSLLLAILDALRAPGALAQTIALAWRLRQPGLRGHLYAAFYFFESLLLARQGRRQEVTHWHNHFGDASGNVTLLAATLRGQPFSLTLHGPDVFFEAHRWRLDLKIRAARFVICVSDQGRARARLFGDEGDAKKLHVVRCAIEGRPLLPDRAPRRGLRLVCVGRLTAAKGHAVLLRALATLEPDVSLRVIGDGPLRASLELRARALGIQDRVMFRGALDEEAVRAELAEADAFVMPSLAEGLPVALLEAMATGVPVIATAIDGIPEVVIDEKNGLLVAPGSSEALAQGISKLRAEPRFAQQLATQARDFVARRHQPEATRQALHALFTNSVVATDLPQQKKRVA